MKYAEQVCSFWPVMRVSVSTWTPTSMDERKTRLTDDREYDQLPDPHGMQEVKAVDRRRDAGPAGVPDRRHGGREVDQVHDFPAEDVSQTVGVGGQRQFRVLGD